MIRILIVDDQEMIRAGLTSVLGSFPDLDVVGAVGDGLTALRQLPLVDVDVVLLDIRMPGIDGVETTRRIRGQLADQPLIVILTTFEEDENVIAALQAGANGFLGKGISATELVAGIRDVYSGGGALSAVAAKALIGRVSAEEPVAVDSELEKRFHRLTKRERETVIAACAGLDNHGIGQQLYLSPLTVKTHLSHAMLKVDARDRAQLVAYAYRAGIVR